MLKTNLITNSTMTTNTNTQTSTTFSPSFLVWIITIIVPVTLITTYSITAALHHDSQVIPFISSSINNAPESCIGSYGLSIASFMMVLAMFVKYLIVKGNIVENVGYEQLESKLKFNKVSFIFGLVSSFSMNGVASFQYKNAVVPHLLFAALFFLCGYIYIVTQTILDDQTSDNPKNISIIRKIICAICSLFITYVILQFFENPILKNLSAILEILSASCIFIYLVSYYFEFSKMTLNIEPSRPLLKNTVLNNSISSY